MLDVFGAVDDALMPAMDPMERGRRVELIRLGHIGRADRVIVELGRVQLATQLRQFPDELLQLGGGIWKQKAVR